MDDIDKRIERLTKRAMDFNAAMPTDVMLKGDGSIWITTHGNEGTRPRKIKQQEVLELIYAAIEHGNKMISI